MIVTSHCSVSLTSITISTQGSCVHLGRLYEKEHTSLNVTDYLAFEKKFYLWSQAAIGLGAIANLTVSELIISLWAFADYKIMASDAYPASFLPTGSFERKKKAEVEVEKAVC